jgi:hypothetical protein
MTKRCGRRLKRTGGKILGQETTTMQWSEWQKSSNAQRKLYIFVAVLGLSMGWLYFGSAARAALRARAVRKPSPVVRAAAPVMAAASPPPARVVVAAPPPPSPEEVMQAQIAEAVGPSSVWGGMVPRPNLGPCQLKISLTAGADKGNYTGDSTLSCANLAPFRPGQRTTLSVINNAQLDAVPVNAMFSGQVRDGAIELVQSKALNFTRQGCNITKLVLTPFQGHLDATWEEGPKNWKEANAVNHCGGEHVTLSRTKTF